MNLMGIENERAMASFFRVLLRREVGGYIVKRPSEWDGSFEPKTIRICDLL